MLSNSLPLASSWRSNILLQMSYLDDVIFLCFFIERYIHLYLLPKMKMILLRRTWSVPAIFMLNLLLNNEKIGCVFIRIHWRALTISTALHRRMNHIGGGQMSSGYPAFKLWKPFKVIYHGRNQNICELFLVNKQKCIVMKSLKHVCIFAFCLAVLYCSKKYTWIGVAQTMFAWHGDLVSKVTVGAL